MQKKKILAMLLSAMIVMSMATVSAFAEDVEPECEHPNKTTTTTDATCTVDGSTVVTCDDCEKEISNTPIPAGHTWDVGEQTKAPTCSATGVTTYTCEVCGDAKTEDIAIDENAHTNTSPVTNDATCTAPGSTVVTCDDCEKEISNTPIPAAGHSFTYTKNDDDSTHAKNCLKCDSEDKANETCTDKGDGTCVCGRTMASQEPGEEKTAITKVNLRMGNFEVGGTLPTVEAEEANVNYTIDYKWFKNGKEVSDLATIEADKYTCQITLTAKEGYTFKGLTIATFPGFTKQPTQPLTVSEDGSEATTSVTIDKSDKKEESGSGSTGGSSSSSSSSSTTKPAVDTKAETDKIAKAEEGSKVSVKIEGTTVPADYIKTAMESKATVVVDYGSYAWEISDVKTAKAVDLSISRYIMPKRVLNTVKGDNSNVISIKHDGDLGFKGTLKYNVKKANAGKFVNLYYYNPKTKKLELQGSTKIGADGNVFLPFTHCSIYVLNITDKAASNELFEDFSAGESATVVEETLPAVTNAPAATEAPATTDAAANPETGNSAVALVAIPMAIAAVAVISKKR